MQIEPTLARSVRLNFGLSRYLSRYSDQSLVDLDQNFGLSTYLDQAFEITSLFDLSRYLDRSLGSAKV